MHTHTRTQLDPFPDPSGSNCCGKLFRQTFLQRPHHSFTEAASSLYRRHCFHHTGTEHCRRASLFTKVMFSQVSVILFMGGGLGVLHPGGGLHPGERGLHPEGLHPGGLNPGRGVGQTLSPSDTTVYGQRAGSRHPAGMHSCLSYK